MNHLSSHNPLIVACQQRRVRLAQIIQAKSGSGVVILSTAKEKARNRIVIFRIDTIAIFSISPALMSPVQP